MDKATVFKIISILMGLTLGLLIAEAGSRIWLFGSDAFSYSKINSVTNLAVSGHIKSADNHKVLYELKPQIDGLFKCKIFRTNELGNRDKAYALTKPEKVIRGVFVGDSFTMGTGVNIEEVYHSVLEEELNKMPGDLKYEMINLGVSGYNLLNYEGVLEEKVSQYVPDFILIGFCGNNDFFLPKQQQLQGNYEVKETSTDKIFFTSFLWRLIDKAFFPARFSKNRPKIAGEEEKEFVDKQFKIFKAFSVDRDIPVVINYLSLVEDRRNLDAVKALALKNDLLFVDSYDKFDYDKISRFYVNRLDHHPNREAHKIFAGTLLDFRPVRQILKVPGANN